MTFSTTPSKRLLHSRLEKRSSTSNTRNANGLDFLPLYSPDLNQIASVWKLRVNSACIVFTSPNLISYAQLLSKQRQRKPPLFVACCENINIYGEDVGSRSKC
jgi:transposase